MNEEKREQLKKFKSATIKRSLLDVFKENIITLTKFLGTIMIVIGIYPLGMLTNICLMRIFKVSGDIAAIDIYSLGIGTLLLIAALLGFIFVILDAVSYLKAKYNSRYLPLTVEDLAKYESIEELKKVLQTALSYNKTFDGKGSYLIRMYERKEGRMILHQLVTNVNIKFNEEVLPDKAVVRQSSNMTIKSFIFYVTGYVL